MKCGSAGSRSLEIFRSGGLQIKSYGSHSTRSPCITAFLRHQYGLQRCLGAFASESKYSIDLAKDTCPPRRSGEDKTERVSLTRNLGTYDVSGDSHFTYYLILRGLSMLRTQSMRLGRSQVINKSRVNFLETSVLFCFQEEECRASHISVEGLA